jgi:hypothetical protein
MPNEGDSILTIEVKNVQPVELADINSALLAINSEYERYVKRNRLQLGQTKLKLYVKSVRPGSSIFDIISMPDWQDMASAVMAQVPLGFVENSNTILRFSEYLKKGYDYFTGKSKDRPSDLERKTLENFQESLAPTVKDLGSSMNFIATHNGQQHITINIGSDDAKTANAAILKELNQDPTATFYQQVVMRFDQGRVSNARAGHFGIIESISSARVKVHFKTEQIREQIMERDDNPFHNLYLIDVEAHRIAIQEKPVLYMITHVHDSWSISED